ncbi:MAG TPA: B12-binding domain-containing radical SAM protein [Deltaproteobacteria bacterium]|nr:B12-binding domain-containing radical SAM protein [Deltaproteobacteria bacterium]
MKITLINPPMPYLINDKASPPMGLMYLGAVLRHAGHDTEIVDLASTPPEDWQIPGNPDYYGVTAATPQYKYACMVKKMIRRQNPGTPIIIGGPHASALPESVLADGFDYVVVGEGENAIRKIVEGDKARGIIMAEPPDDLDALPLPARDLIDILSYSPAMQADKVTTLISSRGCPFKCAFCCKKVFSPKLRFRSPENVMTEIEDIRNNFGINGFVFLDDTFTLHKKRLKEMCARLGRAEISWRCHTRVDQVDKPTLEMLRMSGCTEISFGIESGSQEVLDLLNKGTSVEQNIAALRNAKDVGLITKMYIGFGWPGDNRDTLEATKKLVDQVSPDQCLMGTFVPLPGSAVWERPSEYGIKNINDDFSEYYMVGSFGKAPINFDSEQLNRKEIEGLRDELLLFLQERGFMVQPLNAENRQQENPHRHLHHVNAITHGKSNA